MGEKLEFNYFYGYESEEFTFYRVPRLLIKDKMFSGLSCEAKLLYGLLLDRMSLSRKNDWFDEYNRVYIMYSLESVAEDLGCSTDKAGRVMAELDSKKGIGLIDRVRKGQGKSDHIYVKNFIIVQNDLENEAGNPVNINEAADYEIKKPQNTVSKSRKSRGQETVDYEIKKPQGAAPRNRKTSAQETAKNGANNNNNNYTEMNQTDLIYHSGQNVDISPHTLPEDSMGWDRTEDYYIYERIIQEHIEYDILCQRYPYEINLIDEMVCLMTDIVSVERKTVRINSTDYSYNIVKSIFLKIREPHIEFVLENLKKTPTKVGNMKNYLLTTLYNAYCTYHNDAAAYVNYVRHEVEQEEGGS